MNKRIKCALTAAAMGAALFSGAAFAQSSVNLYGQIDAWAGVQKFPGSKSSVGVQGGGMSTSYWGLKGTEDLGGGYKTIFQLEDFFLPQTGAYGRFQGDSFFSRNSYVGIEAPWGTVKAGRLTTELFISTILFNPFIDSYEFSPMVWHVYLGMGTFPTYTTDQGVTGDSGWNNAVEYSTPDYNGLTASAMYGFGNTAGSAGYHKDSVQALYFHGPFAATAVYQYVNFNSAAKDLASTDVTGLTSQSVVQLGATYDLKFAKLYAQYMYTYNKDLLGNFKVNTGQLGATIPFGVGHFMLSDAYSKDSGGFKTTHNTWAVGYDYPLSKRTDVYAAYMSDRYTGGQSVQATAEGAVPTIGTGNTAGVGLRHEF